MAKSGDSGGWSDLLKDLVRNFLLLRDLFGYALPGAIFLLIGVLRGRIPVQAWWKYYPVPVWAATVIAVAAAYAAGHVLAAIAYLPIDLWKLGQIKNKAKLKKFPTEVNPQELYWRRRFPDLFLGLDRRETLSVLSATLAAALVVGFVLFCCWNLSWCVTLLLGGLVMAINFATALPDLVRVRENAIEASEHAAKDPPASPSAPED